MSEKLHVCQALAAMVRQDKEISEEEVTFVGHAAFELSLSTDENEKVQQTLLNGGDFKALLSEVTSKPMRLFLFRRVVAVCLIDAEISESEMRYISETAKGFNYDKHIVELYISWMREGIQWEKRGVDIMARLPASA